MEKLGSTENNSASSEAPDAGWGKIEALAIKQASSKKGGEDSADEDFDEHEDSIDEDFDEHEGGADEDSDEYDEDQDAWLEEDDYADDDEEDEESYGDDDESDDDESDADDEDYENDADDDDYDDYDDDFDSYDDDDDEDDRHYHEDNERTEMRDGELKIREIALPEKILRRYEFIEKLPESVAVMGGVARSIARELLTGEREPIRDIDLVEITGDDGEGIASQEVLDELARTYMPDDYAFGHGIRRESLNHYFSSRDFTINQCLIKNGKLLVSELAENDFKENIIRPTYYELPYGGKNLSSRLFLKAIMMRTVVAQISKSIPLLEDVNINPRYVGSFDKALFLNKAMSRGAETAIGFTEDLAEWGVIDESFAGRPIALAKKLMNWVYSFKFRPSSDEQFMDASENHDLGGFFVPKAMREYYAADPIIAGAMAEYDGAEPGPGMGELYSGHYTQAHYDEINNAQGEYSGDYYDC